MNKSRIIEMAEEFGLTIEALIIPEREKAFRVFKGANQIFVGTEEAVREFLLKYEKDRPGLFEGSMYGYLE
ncbi:MAG: hypothetical protein AB7Q37_15625 [Pyrinomonadaceae bacterium]